MVIETYSGCSNVACNHKGTIWQKHWNFYLYITMNIRNGMRARDLGITYSKFVLSHRESQGMYRVLFYRVSSVLGLFYSPQQCDTHNWQNGSLIFISMTSWRLLSWISLVSPCIKPIHISVLHFVLDGISLHWSIASMTISYLKALP